MHGLVNRSIQCFLRDTYGAAVWSAVTRAAGIGFDSFEPMLIYDAALTDALVEGAAQVLERPRETVLEDLGTYLVSHPNLERLRRLLRFGGVTFPDFLHSLEDLPERARLALPEMELPDLHLADLGGGRFRLTCGVLIPGAGHVVTGLLRAMADDYGALAVLEHDGTAAGGEVVAIQLLDPRFAQGRRFDLTAEA
ncbi:MAG: heme NO-binding domain-containing protein [Paracoccaceae bacterium]